jgi:hypothetical protein
VLDPSTLIVGVPWDWAEEMVRATVVAIEANVPIRKRGVRMILGIIWITISLISLGIKKSFSSSQTNLDILVNER